MACELSIPFGERFNFFRSISDADLDIRRALIIGDYRAPTELIAFLETIYTGRSFSDLVEVAARKTSYFCIRQPDDRYVREDYFSSGEYFLVSLYRRLRARCRLIFIDELDISLDASAQVRLVSELRRLCDLYGVTVAFTTHSLAMMKTLAPGELNYMEMHDGQVAIEPASYNYIKSLLYGFRGWDKYILTEDEVLQEFIEHLISRYCIDIFYKYIVIYVGGGTNVTDMLRRNASEGFFSEASNVLAVLDGDQAGMRHAATAGTVCLPIESVEKALHALYQRGDFQPRLSDPTLAREPKTLFKQLLRQQVISKQRVFEILCDAHSEQMQAFALQLSSFLKH